MTIINHLIEEFKNENRWVNYRLKKVDDTRTTKLPYNPHTNRLASSTDPKTWADYETAKKNSDRIGIIFTADKKLIGIDIDHCLNEDTKELEHPAKEQIEALIKACNSYTEISPSGTGIHIYVKTTEPFDLIANRHQPYEIYNSGRYFTVTENPYKEYNIPIQEYSNHELFVILTSAIGYPWTHIEDVAPLVQQILQPHTLDDNELLQKMFESKTGKKIQALYNTTGETNLSSEDLSLCSSLAFWTRKDFNQIERIWLSSPLGQRKKTQSRPDYRKMTIDQAIKGCKDVYDPSPMSTKIVEKMLEKETPELDLLFTSTKDGGKVFVVNTENVCRILQYHSAFTKRIRYDKFKNTLEYDPYGAGCWRGFEDGDEIDIQTKISVLFPPFLKVTKNMIVDAVLKVARDNQFDSAIDFITAMVWDKEPRLDHWLSNTYGTPDDEYHASVGANWIKGLVKRIVVPGCKFDYVLVLEGEQGSKKSTSLSVLGEMEHNYNLHVETSMSTESKDFFLQFGGKAIIEFSEGETLSRTEVKKMKSIITTQTDRYRVPYGKVSQDFPRRCVFAMTTNESEYLKDDTGNRRWLPVKVQYTQANVDWLRDNRDQLFAEAYYRIHVLKETIYEFPASITEQQNKRRIRDVNADTIVDWYESLTEDQKNAGVVVREIYHNILGNGTFAKAFDKLEEMKIAGTLKADLNLEKRRVRYNGAQSNRWFPRELPVQEVIEGLADVEEVDEYAEVLKNF